MSDGIPLLDSWITKATVARDALAKAEERIRELEAEMACAYQQLDEEREGRAEEEARAEKAEAAAHTEATAAQIHFEARQRLEARVAELEDALVEQRKELHASIEKKEDLEHFRRDWLQADDRIKKLEKLIKRMDMGEAAYEAREREAD